MQSLVEGKTENEHVQQYAHREENGEGIESNLQPMLNYQSEKEEETA